MFLFKELLLQEIRSRMIYLDSLENPDATAFNIIYEGTFESFRAFSDCFPRVGNVACETSMIPEEILLSVGKARLL